MPDVNVTFPRQSTSGLPGEKRIPTFLKLIWSDFGLKGLTVAILFPVLVSIRFTLATENYVVWSLDAQT